MPVFQTINDNKVLLTVLSRSLFTKVQDALTHVKKIVAVVSNTLEHPVTLETGVPVETVSLASY